MHHSSIHMLYNIFRWEIWILRHFTNREANLGWNITVLNYNHTSLLKVVSEVPGTREHPCATSSTR